MSRLLNPVRHVFLDRDGVINIKLPQHQYVTSPDALRLCPGAAESIARLNQAGIPVLVITNQRGISLGLFSEQQLEAVHARMRNLLQAHDAHIDAVYYCPHALNTCNCRKPLPGMFHQAFRDFPAASPANSILVGDSLSDIEAGFRLGMRTIFIEGNPETQDPGVDEARRLATHIAPSLAKAVEFLLPPDQ